MSVAFSHLGAAAISHQQASEHQQAQAAKSPPTTIMTGCLGAIERAAASLSPEAPREHAALRAYVARSLKLLQVDLVSRHDGRACAESRPAVARWSRAAELFFAYFTLKLLAVQYLQHEYNQITFELAHSNATPESHLTQYNSATGISQQQQQQLEMRLVGAIERLELLGNPYYELGFPLEVVLLIILLINLLIYSVTHFALTHFMGPMHFGHVGLLLDSKQERALLAGQTRRAATSILAALLGFQQTAKVFEQLQLLEDEGGQWPWWSPWRQATHQATADTPTRRLAEALRRFVRYNCLVPLNRHDQWPRLLFAAYASFVVGNHLVSIPFVIIILVLLPLSDTLGFELHTSPRDLLFGAELMAYTVLGQQAVCFYITVLFIECLDHIKYALELDASILRLVRSVQLTIEHQHQHQHQHHELNLKLALVLIHYKLFRHQLCATKRFVGYGGGVTFCLMVLLPLLGRVYIAFLDFKLRWLVVGCAVIYVVSCDLFIIPNCYLQARCLDIVRHLSSLLARLVQAEEHNLAAEHALLWSSHFQREEEEQQPPQEQQQQQRAATLYNQQLVRLLRRELRNQPIVVAKLETNALFLRLTYADLLGVHFWCGLVLASLLLTDPSKLHFTGNLLVDSLTL